MSDPRDPDLEKLRKQNAKFRQTLKDAVSKKKSPVPIPFVPNGEKVQSLGVGFKPGEISVFALPGLSFPRTSIVLNEMMYRDLLPEQFVIPTEMLPENALRILGIDPQKEKDHAGKLIGKVAVVSTGDVHKHLEAIKKASSEKGPTVVIDSIATKDNDRGQ